MESDSEFKDAEEFIQSSSSTHDAEVSVHSSSTPPVDSNKPMRAADLISPSSSLTDPKIDKDTQQEESQLESSKELYVDAQENTNLIDFDLESEHFTSPNEELSRVFENPELLEGLGFSEAVFNTSELNTQGIMSEFGDLHLGQQLDTTDLIGDFANQRFQSDIRTENFDKVIESSGVEVALRESEVLGEMSEELKHFAEPQVQHKQPTKEGRMSTDENLENDRIHDSLSDLSEESNDVPEEFNGFEGQMDPFGEAFDDDFDDDFSNMNQLNEDGFNDDFGEEFDDFAEAHPKDTPLSGLLTNDPELAKSTVAKVLDDIFQVSLEKNCTNSKIAETKPRLWSTFIEQNGHSSSTKNEPFEWIRSQIRRDFLISLNIPINLDEIYTQRASVLKIDSPAAHSGSGPVDEFDIAMARSLCNISEETIRTYPLNDLVSLLDQLTSLSKQTHSYLEYWVKQQDKVKVEAEAIHKTIECMVSHAQKNRDKQSGELKWFKKRISGISKATSPRSSGSIDMSRRRLSM